MPPFNYFGSMGFSPPIAEGQGSFSDSIDVSDYFLDPAVGGVPNANRVPYDALGAMMGIDIPSLPDRNAQGRYGITEGQAEDAGNRGMAQAFFGAAQSFMGGGPAPSMQGGMQAGNMRNQLLDKASQQNVQDYDMKLKNAIANVELIKSRSAVENAQLNAEEQLTRLDQAKQQRGIVDAYMSELKPVADQYIQEAYRVSEGFGNDIRMKMLQVQAAAQKGDLAMADQIQNEISLKFESMDPSGEMSRRWDESVKTATLKGLAKHQVDASVLQQVMQMPEFQGYSFEMGQDGNMNVISPFEQERRDLLMQQARAQVGLTEANAAAAMARSRGVQMLKPAEINKRVSAANKAAEILSIPKPLDQGKVAQWMKDQASAQAALQDIGISDPQSLAQWTSMAPMDKFAHTMRISQAQAAMMMGGMMDPSMMSGLYGGGGGFDGGMQTQPPTNAGVGMALVKKGMQEATTDADAAQVLDALSRMNEPILQGYFKQAQGSTPLEKLRWIHDNLVGPRYINPQH